MVYIINKIFQSGVFPADLKIARVVPMHKSEDKIKPVNYRPISVLPSISKIYEHVIYNRLYSFLDKFKILSSQQFGFRKSCATNNAIVNLTDFVIP